MDLGDLPKVKRRYGFLIAVVWVEIKTVRNESYREEMVKMDGFILKNAWVHGERAVETP